MIVREDSKSISVCARQKEKNSVDSEVKPRPGTIKIVLKCNMFMFMQLFICM